MRQWWQKIKEADFWINPIWLLELRTQLRTRRFFLGFVTALTLSVITIVIAMLAISSGSNTAPDEIGRGVFFAFLFLEHTIIAIFFPAFSCTSIIGESDKKTLDLLLASDLTPQEIVRGKFVSAFTYAFLFLIASFPLCMVSFLFGGVDPRFMLACYLVLMLISALYIMIALWASSFFKTLIKAIIGSYSAVFMLGILGIFFAIILIEEYLYRNSFVRFFSAPLNPVQVLVVAIPIVTLILITILAYLLAVNQLKEPEENRSTCLRIYCVIGFAVMVSMAIFLFSSHAQDTLARKQKLDESLYIFSMFLNICLGMLLLFATLAFTLESPIHSFQVLKKIKAMRHFRRLAWLFFPGVSSGAVFVLSLSFVSLAAPSFALFVLTRGFDSNLFRQFGEFQSPECFFIPPIVIWSFLFFLAMLCMHLTLRFRNSRTGKAIAMIVAATLGLILPLYLPISMAVDGRYSSGILDLGYLSPTVCFFSAFLRSKRRDVCFLLFNAVPIHWIGIFFYLFAGALLIPANLKRLRARSTSQERSFSSLVESQALGAG